MLHAGYHEEPQPILLLRSHFYQHTRIIIDSVLRRDRPAGSAIIPAMKDEKFPTTSPKGGKIRIHGVDETGFLVDQGGIGSRSNVRQSHAGSAWATNLNIPTSIDPGSGLAPVN